MKRFLIIVSLVVLSVQCFSIRKALVIGNAAYTESPLRNPVNDAQAVSEKLQNLGFIVTVKTNLDKENMDLAIDAFINSLNSGDESLFYYSGHGASAEGENYLIPINANIDSTIKLKNRATKCSEILELLKVKSDIAIVVLDACRDNPYKYTKDGSKGLAQMNTKFPNQYIIYSTSPGRTANDGTGNLSPFTTSFIDKISNGKKITDTMQDIATDVYSQTNGNQVPWAEGVLLKDFYFAKNVTPAPKPQTAPDTNVDGKPLSPLPDYEYGRLEINSNVDGEVTLLPTNVKYQISAGIKLPLKNIQAGNYTVELRYKDHSNFQKSTTQSFKVVRDDAAVVNFAIDLNLEAMVMVNAGSFMMGDIYEDGAEDEQPAHQVNIGKYYINKYEITQKQWQEVMGSNPSCFQGDTLPVESVSWYDVLVFCNKLSIREGLTPCYSIAGSTNPSLWGDVPDEVSYAWDSVICNWSANGYRLPTEAEWEYAARGGAKSKGYIYSGSSIIDNVAWFWDNSEQDYNDNQTHSVGDKQANELGLFDMTGNVWEWCWDWYDKNYYSKSPLSNPHGADFGEYRVVRGGSWYNDAKTCRILYRGNYGQTVKDYYVGFRYVRNN